MLDLGSVTHSVVETRAGGETDDYNVTLWRIVGSSETQTFSRPMRECSGIELFQEGTYRMQVASSAQCPGAGFDTPWYVGRTEEFSVINGRTTTLGNIECTQGNVKITIGYGESLLNILDTDNVVVTCKIGANSIDFPYGESRAGYLSVGNGGGQVAMDVTFNGVVDTAPIESTETIMVAPGQWQRLRFVLEGDNSFRIVTMQSGAGQIGDGAEWYF